MGVFASLNIPYSILNLGPFSEDVVVILLYFLTTLKDNSQNFGRREGVKQKGK